jgi:hypothetical protein
MRQTVTLFKTCTLVVCFVLALHVNHSFAAPADDPRCASNIRAQIQAATDMSTARAQNIFRSVYTAPAPLSQVANMPCQSRELQRIGNSFAYEPSKYGYQVQGIANGLAGPASALMNSFFRAGIKDFHDMANYGSVAQAAFQDYASQQLGGLLSSLGLEDTPFNDALCGLMVDALVKYALCELPDVNLPDLPNLGSWGIPGCAGEAITGALNEAAYNQSIIPMNQPILIPPGGLYGPQQPSLSPDLPWANR